MKKVKDFWLNLPWYVKNIYSVLLLVFVVWMIFLDRNSLVSQMSINQQLNQLEDQKEYFVEELESVNEVKKELFSTDENKEKFAREHYMMKKENEDIFIIVEK